MSISFRKQIVMFLQGTQVEGPIPAPDLAPVAPAAQHAPAMAPAPSAMAAANAVNPLSFLVKVPLSSIPVTMPLKLVQWGG